MLCIFRTRFLDDTLLRPVPTLPMGYCGQTILPMLLILFSGFNPWKSLTLIIPRFLRILSMPFFLIIVSIIFCYSSFLHSLGDYLWDDHCSDLFWFLWRQIMYCLLIWFSHLCAWNYANLVFKWQAINNHHYFLILFLWRSILGWRLFFLDELCVLYRLDWTWFWIVCT